jgi:hypothetical protein
MPRKESIMTFYSSELRERVDEARNARLEDLYRELNPHLRAAVIHARAGERRREIEPSGGDSALD